MLVLHQESLIMRHTPPPFFLPERCLFLLVRHMKKSGVCTDSDNISRVSHVSVKQRILQSLMFLWKATCALISSTVLSRDWTIATNILRSCGWCARLLSRTRRPLCLPLLWRQRCFGSASGIRSKVQGGGPNKGAGSGKSYSWS